MANNNESTMKWKVDISQLKSAMQDAKRSISLATAEFKTATAGIDKWQKSTTGLEAKLKQLNSTLPQQKKILADLEKQYDLTAKNMGENSSEAQRLKIQIENQRGAIAKTEASISKFNTQLAQMKAEEAESGTKFGQLTAKIKEQENQLADLKEEYAKSVINSGKYSKETQNLAKQIESLSGELADNKKKMNDAEKAADGLDQSIEEAGKDANDAAKGGFTVLKGAMANLVADGISKAIDGLKELSRQVIEIGKQSIANYADYEQLVGGVETLFKDSAGIVEGYANDAFKTAGMSANQYMETVTSFSSSLLQGLGGDTKKAAELADLAITDMSDNANKMGTDMTLIQNAYQGFAKGNFTMLDNLKLGYGGTQTEMIRLINDSGVLEKKIKKIDEVTFDQMILAIHAIQDEIGITGTTAAEAADTIEGSKSSMMASWSNLLTEFSKSDGDVGAAFDTFVDSAMTYLDNLLPRVGELMDNVVGLIRDKLEESAPELLKIFDLISDGFQWIIDNKDVIIAALAGIGAAIVAWNLTSVVQSVIAFAKALKGMGLQAAFAAAKQWLLNTALFANPVGLVIAAIAGLVVAFVVLWKKSDKFRKFWIDLWKKIVEVAKLAWQKIKEFFSNAWKKIQEIWGKAVAYFQGIWSGIKQAFADVKIWFANMFTSAWNAIKNAWSGVKTWFSNIWSGIKNVFSNVSSYFREKFQDAWNAIKNVFSSVGTFFGNIWETIKSKFSDIGQKVGDAIGGTFKKAINAVLSTAETVLNKPITAINGLIEKLRNVPGFGWMSTLSTFSLPRMAKGGVLRKGQVGLLEGSGAEAVVPLEKNKQWIAAVVKEMVNQLNIKGVKGAVGRSILGMNGVSGATATVRQTQNVTFNQYNTSPKALDRLSVYRDTNNLLFSAKVRLSNV